MESENPRGALSRRRAGILLHPTSLRERSRMEQDAGSTPGERSSGILTFHRPLRIPIRYRGCGAPRAFAARGVSRVTGGRSLAPRERSAERATRRAVEALWPSRPPAAKPCRTLRAERRSCIRVAADLVV